MPEHKLDSRGQLRELRRISVEIKLMIRMILDHYGLPRVTAEEVNKALAEEGWARPVKSPPSAEGHPSTGGPAVHRQPRATRPTDEEA